MTKMLALSRQKDLQVGHMVRPHTHSRASLDGRVNFNWQASEKAAGEEGDGRTDEAFAKSLISD